MAVLRLDETEPRRTSSIPCSKSIRIHLDDKCVCVSSRINKGEKWQRVNENATAQWETGEVSEMRTNLQLSVGKLLKKSQLTFYAKAEGSFIWGQKSRKNQNGHKAGKDWKDRGNDWKDRGKDWIDREDEKAGKDANYETYKKSEKKSTKKRKMRERKK